METTQVKRQCPFSGGFVYLCGKSTCEGCTIREEFEKKENEKVGEHMQEYWKHQNSGAEK